MAASITVKNVSDWPTWLVRYLVRKACADASITWFEWQHVTATERRGHWGCAMRDSAGRSWCRRRGTPPLTDRALRACLEHLPDGLKPTPVVILALGIRLAADRARHPMADDRNRAQVAGEFVDRLSRDRSITGEWLALARKHRPIRIDRTERTLVRYTALLTKWERRAEISARRVKKYRRLVYAAKRRAERKPAARKITRKTSRKSRP